MAPSGRVVTSVRPKPCSSRQNHLVPVCLDQTGPRQRLVETGAEGAGALGRESPGKARAHHRTHGSAHEQAFDRIRHGHRDRCCPPHRGGVDARFTCGRHQLVQGQASACTLDEPSSLVARRRTSAAFLAIEASLPVGFRHRATPIRPRARSSRASARALARPDGPTRRGPPPRVAGMVRLPRPGARRERAPLAEIPVAFSTMPANSSIGIGNRV